MPTSTPRGFRYPLNSDAPNIQTHMGNLATDIDNQFIQSTAAARPAAGVVGRQHRATDTGAVSLDIGSAWVDITNPDNTTVERASGVMQVKDGGITAAKIANALKPSGGAAAGTEALRALGTTASTAAAGNDSRLSDQRVPTDSSVTNAKVANGAAIDEAKLNLASDAAAGTASRRTLGTGASQAAAGNHTHAPNHYTDVGDYEDTGIVALPNTGTWIRVKKNSGGSPADFGDGWAMQGTWVLSGQVLVRADSTNWTSIRGRVQIYTTGNALIYPEFSKSYCVCNQAAASPGTGGWVTMIFSPRVLVVPGGQTYKPKMEAAIEAGPYGGLMHHGVDSSEIITYLTGHRIDHGPGY